MQRRVASELLNRWIEENSPMGFEKLALESQVSTATIGKARRGAVPYRPVLRRALANAIGVSEDELFPPVADPYGGDSA